MKDEIKEILDDLKNYANEGGEHTLMEYEIKHIQCYITNLQEENKRLKELCDKYEEEHNTAFKLWTMKMEEIPTYEEKKELQNRIKELEQINEEHRKLNGELREENKELLDETIKLTELWLKEREKIRKVIEYLEAPNRDNFDYCKAYMIQILQGSDE